MLRRSVEPAKDMRAGLLPVKSLSAAKSRLGVGLRPQDRQAVVRALCEDALDLVAEDRELRWWIVTHDPEVKEMAPARCLATIVDGGGGLNRVLLHASERAGIHVGVHDAERSAAGYNN